MAMLALVASLFAVQPAHADELAAGTALDVQSKEPKLVVQTKNSVTVGKSIKIKAENRTADQTGTWVWEVAKGSSLVQLTNASKSTVTVKGVKGGSATLKLSYITDSGKKSSKNVTVNVYGIQNTKVLNGIVYKRIGVDKVRVQATKGNKDLGKAKIVIKKQVKLGDSTYKATYKVTAVKSYSLNMQKKTTKITIGDNVGAVGVNAFAGNPKMKTLTLGKGVTKLGRSIVTAGDKACKTITINSTKLKKANVKNCFKGAKYLKTVKVPKSKVAAYKKIFTKENCGANVKVVAI